ncbi:sqd [Symbiodinium sp. KB8]|nr:sqd [Symbiodinium sp. KB8]
MGAHPAVSSALDNVALSIGDVLDAATQDLSEMAGDLKSFVASEPDEEQKAEAASKKVLEAVSPRSRQEAAGAISDFCQKYPAARVRPTTQELEKLWAAIGGLKPVALNSAFYDELSFSNGDTSWQPRLRVLFALEFLFRKDGPGKEVAISVFHQARSLILHLTEVQQCAEKAKEVIRLFSRKEEKEAPEEAKEAKDGKAKAKAKPAPAPEADLLDMSAPVATVPSAAASAAPGATPAAVPAALDLLGELQESPAPAPAAPAAVPATAPAATAGASASAVSGTATAVSPLSPSAALALALSSAPMAPTATLPQEMGLGPARGAQRGSCASQAEEKLVWPASGLPFAGLGVSAAPAAPAAPPTGMGLPGLGNANAKAAPRVPPPFASRGKVGHPYMPIPASLDSPSQPPPVDQFAFVSDITGIGDLAKPAK